MYQAEEKIEFIVVANNIAHWAETLFGYFVKANKNDDEKLELIEAFAEELEKIPSECMFYLQQAKDKWIQEAHQRPPSVSQFLQILRELNNAHVNQKYKTMIEHRQVDYAGLWGICKTDDQKKNYMKTTFNLSEVPDATKYWVRKWMRDSGFTSEKITGLLGTSW